MWVVTREKLIYFSAKSDSRSYARAVPTESFYGILSAASNHLLGCMYNLMQNARKFV
jgi:hypothetical protein